MFDWFGAHAGKILFAFIGLEWLLAILLVCDTYLWETGVMYGLVRYVLMKAGIYLP